MQRTGFTLAGGFCGAWQGASPNAVSEQSVDDCEPAIIQESGFSVARNKIECAKVTTKRNERNFLKKFLKWSYQVVTARKIQDKGFTLAEVLITLAIIGVVAAIAIPSVISNSQQQEFRTGLRKAVSVLNSAITMNMATDGESPYDNANLFGYLTKSMNVIKTTSRREYEYHFTGGASALSGNSAFYTTDGMVYELRAGVVQAKLPLYENKEINVCTQNVSGSLAYGGAVSCGGCGSYGLNSNTDKTTKPPCLIVVDVNGNKKPNPSNVNCKADSGCSVKAKFSDPLGLKLTDLFTIMITDKSAIPYGIAAQRAMYQARK